MGAANRHLMDRQHGKTATRTRRAKREHYDATAQASLRASAVNGASIEEALFEMIRDLHKSKQDVQEAFRQHIEANGMPRIVVMPKEPGR